MSEIASLRVYRIQIIAVCDVGFWVNPLDLLPEQAREVFRLRAVEDENSAHEYVQVFLPLRRFKSQWGQEGRVPLWGTTKPGGPQPPVIPGNWTGELKTGLPVARW